MKKFRLSPWLIPAVLLFPLASFALLGNLEPEARTWGMSNGFNVGTTERGGSGCRKGKRYVSMEKTGVKAFAIFYHPGYDEETGSVTQVEFEFNPPIGTGAARQYGIMVAPIVGTRGPTHQQRIKPEAGNPCIGPNGGSEERYTKDYILEYLNAPGGRGIQLLRVYNDYIR